MNTRYCPRCGGEITEGVAILAMTFPSSSNPVTPKPGTRCPGHEEPPIRKSAPGEPLEHSDEENPTLLQPPENSDPS